MKIKDKWSLVKPSDLFSILFGIASVVVLCFALLSLNDALTGGSFDKLYFLLVFVALSASRGILAFYYGFFERQNKIAFYKNLGIATVYLIVVILIAVIYSRYVYFFHLVLGLYIATIAANRICLIFEKRKLFSTIYNIVLLSILVLLFVAVYASPNATDESSVMTVLLFFIIIISFAEVLGFAFSKIKLKGLLKIIRKTYIIEIIYGLVMLMVSFSFYFMIMEDNIKTFGDGLWYSFSIVTTIGLGDVYAVSPIGRVLSVILGIYGLIVVAAFTSVFVNFYNETKASEHKNDEEKIRELEKRLEEKEAERKAKKEKSQKE